MPWNGSGVVTLLYSWVARRDAGSPTNIIGATEMEAQDQDLADAIENAVARDGQNTASADLPMATFKHTNVGAATARTNYLRVAEYQDGGHVWVAGAGTDTITATYAPALTALTNGTCVRFRAAAANATTTPTFAPNGLTAKTIVKGANAALVAGDIAGQHHECIVQYNSTTDAWHLLNPAYPVATGAIDLNSLTTDSTGGAAADFIPFVDASESNASNKVLVPDFFTNGIAALTTDSTGGATGDFIPFTDASETNTANKVTIDSLMTNSMQLLTIDNAGFQGTDQIPFMDASESLAANRCSLNTFLYGGINYLTTNTAHSLGDFLLMADNVAIAPRKIDPRHIGTGKQTVWVPAAAMTSRTTNGAASGTTESTTNKVMNKVLDFDTTTQEFAQFTVAFPKGWNEGTVTFIPYWTAASSTGGVVWGLAGVAISNDDVIDAAFGTAQTSTDTLIATTDIHVGPESAAITIAGTPAVDDICYFQINRTVADGGDTLGADARLIGIKLIYTIDSNVDD